YDISERDALTAALAALEPEKPAPDPGEGWRIAEGDDWKDGRFEIWLAMFGRWEIRDPEDACTRFDGVSFYRVPIDPEPNHPPIPEGWRLLGDNEPIQEGDKWLPSWTKDWIPSCGDESQRARSQPYIRRIAPKF